MTSLQQPSGLLSLARTYLFAASVPFLLRLRLPRLEQLLQPRGRRTAATKEEPEAIVRQVDRVVRRGMPLIRSSCLTRGVTLYYFLRRAGFDVSLCFGIGKADSEVVAHCWLSRDGEPYLEERDPRPLYLPMYTFRGEGKPGGVCDTPPSDGCRTIAVV